MTSGNFRSVPIDSIAVERADRQRQTLTGIDELAESIFRIGLINPIVITSEGVLVAGERRLTACRQLGWTSISAQYAEDLSDYELQTIELEENVKRVNLSWQEEVAALARFHALKVENEPDWTQADTADALGYSRQDVSKKLTVACEMHNPVVAQADRLSAAANIVSRNMERKKTSALESVGTIAFAASRQAGSEGDDPDADAGRSEVQAPVIPLLNVSFHDWQPGYDGPKFNLIHCDFPYGINVADSPRMDATIKDHYEDSPDIYWSLLSRLAAAMDNVVADSAHLIFWHSMNYHADTLDMLTRMGWKCNPFPLIWHKSDGSGIAPDPQRGPRQVYEAAIFATRIDKGEDRKITQEGCVANVFAHPGRRDGAIHVSEKPMPMLRHFMRMVCDEYSSVLDPTCGSANALKVAEGLGASSVLGLEQFPDFYETACINWSKRDA
jgi:ParB/RepB/Spo0J family partition protein